MIGLVAIHDNAVPTLDIASIQAVREHCNRFVVIELPLAAALDGPVRFERVDRRFVDAAVRGVVRDAEDDEVPLRGVAGIQDAVFFDDILAPGRFAVDDLDPAADLQILAAVDAGREQGPAVL